jgi:hypothetical protein
MNKQRATSLLVLSVLVSAGCYVEQPLTNLPPAPATRISAELSDSGTVAMSNAIGPGATLVEGVVSSASSDEWVLQMVRVDHRDGRSVDWNGEPVRFAPNFLTQPTVRKLDKGRSWLAAGGILIGAFALAQAFDLFGSPEEDDGGPQPPASLIPAGGR